MPNGPEWDKSKYEPTASGGTKTEQRTISATQIEDFNIKLTLHEDELSDIATFVPLHGEAINAFIRQAISNHLFIREAYQKGSEFLIREADRKYYRVNFL
jgi:hypothetical protein